MQQLAPHMPVGQLVPLLVCVSDTDPLAERSPGRGSVCHKPFLIRHPVVVPPAAPVRFAGARRTINTSGVNLGSVGVRLWSLADWCDGQASEALTVSWEDDQIIAAHAERRRILTEVYGKDWLQQAPSEFLRMHRELGFNFDLNGVPLYGLFRLVDSSRAQLEEIVNAGRALVMPDGGVVEDVPVYQFHWESRQLETRYAKNLDEFFEIAMGYEPSDTSWTGFRGQTVEYVHDVNGWVSFQPGSFRRSRWPGEWLHATDVEAAYREIPVGEADPIRERMAAERHYVLRRTADPDDPWFGIHRAIEPFLREDQIADKWALDAILQHYGPATESLDVTRDPATALFFALNTFVPLDDRRVTYRPATAPGVVYVLGLELNRHADQLGPAVAHPWLDLRTLLVDNADLRPQRQRGVILRPHAVGVIDGPLDEVSCGEIAWTRIIVSPEILNEMAGESGMPDQTELFPSPEVDPLYGGLAELPYVPLYVTEP